MLVVALLVLRGGGDPYTVEARFTNASLLVEGGRVEVAGVPIGTIRRVTLARDGQASVHLEITDERFRPLRRGSRVSIRSVGQATITNRYVEIGPAPESAEPIPDGGVIPSTRTAGVVDLDAVFNTMDPSMRERIKGLVTNSAGIYAGSGGRAFNDMLAALDPALVPIGELLGDLAADRDEIGDLLRHGSVAAKALGDRHEPLARAVERTAVTMTAVARERGALADSLTTAPDVLGRAARTLRSVATTAEHLRPTLRAVAPVQPGLRRLLRRVPVALDTAREPLDAVARIVDPLRRALTDLVPLEHPTRAALGSAAGALEDSMPIIEGLRFYSSDIVLGVVNGLVGISTGPYNRYGHYLKVEFLQSPQTAVGGLLSPLFPGLTRKSGIVPGVLNMQFDQRSRCPGSNAPPAPDGSNPWYPKEGICDPRQSMSGLVNEPDAVCSSASTCEGDRRSLEPDPTGRGDLERAAGR